MKKLITLLLFMGCVCTASAAKLYVCLSHSSKYWPESGAKIYAHLWGATGADVLMTQETKFGNYWYSCELNGNTNAVICRMSSTFESGDLFQNNNQYIWNQTNDITGLSTTTDTYIRIYGSSGNLSYETATQPTEWNRMVFRGNIKDTWSSETPNTTRSDDGYTFSYTLTKDEIDTYEGEDTDIRFRFAQLGDVCFNYETKKTNDNVLIYPDENGESLSWNTPVSPSFVNTEWATSYYWSVTLPTFDYEKIVISATYVETTAPAGEWKISADAYIKKTVLAANKYATLGAPVALDLTKLPTDLKAYTATADASTGKITTVKKETALAAGEGVLLENVNAGNQDVTLSIPVLASAAASASNDMKAFNGVENERLYQPNDGNTYYILGKQNNHVGFYKVNATKGNPMSNNSAYLSVSTGSSNARDFFLLDVESGTTGVEGLNNSNTEELKPYYNLAGQRVAQPTKGLYIVNGKKVLVK